MTNYYSGELNKLDVGSKHFVTVRFIDGDGTKTKTMNLTLESIPEIIRFLKAEEARLVQGTLDDAMEGG